jgi:hypothetical protein
VGVWTKRLTAFLRRASCGAASHLADTVGTCGAATAHRCGSQCVLYTMWLFWILYGRPSGLWSRRREAWTVARRAVWQLWFGQTQADACVLHRGGAGLHSAPDSCACTGRSQLGQCRLATELSRTRCRVHRRASQKCFELSPSVVWIDCLPSLSLRLWRSRLDCYYSLLGSTALLPFA